MFEQTIKLTCDNSNCGTEETDTGAIQDRWYGFNAKYSHISGSFVNVGILSDEEKSDWAGWSFHACRITCLGPAVAQKLDAQMQTPHNIKVKAKLAKRSKR